RTSQTLPSVTTLLQALRGRRLKRAFEGERFRWVQPREIATQMGLARAEDVPLDPRLVGYLNRLTLTALGRSGGACSLSPAALMAPGREIATDRFVKHRIQPSMGAFCTVARAGAAGRKDGCYRECAVRIFL